jgi:phosphoribosylanthranilate isomerase
LAFPGAGIFSLWHFTLFSEYFTMRNIIQIAGIIDREEAEMLISAGVNWLGFPFRLPVNKEDISEENAAEIIASLKPPHAGVLITYLQTAEEIVQLCRKLQTNTVQIHGQILLSEMQKLRSLMPQFFVIKSLVVRENNLAELARQAEQFQPWVDAFITDTHDPATGADGATGKTHDWNISRRLVEISSKPVILAGGLTPENVRQAILTARPAGVDAHTGVEDATGRKCPKKIAVFVSEARKAFKENEE